MRFLKALQPEQLGSASPLLQAPEPVHAINREYHEFSISLLNLSSFTNSFYVDEISLSALALSIDRS